MLDQVQATNAPSPRTRTKDALRRTLVTRAKEGDRTFTLTGTHVSIAMWLLPVLVGGLLQYDRMTQEQKATKETTQEHTRVLESLRNENRQLKDDMRAIVNWLKARAPKNDRPNFND